MKSTVKTGTDLSAEKAKSVASQPETSSAPDNSMATHAGSLSGAQDNPTTSDQEAAAENKKSRKCCVIL